MEDSLGVGLDLEKVKQAAREQEEAQEARERERQEKLQQGMPEHLRSVRDDGFELLEQDPLGQRSIRTGMSSPPSGRCAAIQRRWKTAGRRRNGAFSAQ